MPGDSPSSLLTFCLHSASTLTLFFTSTPLLHQEPELLLYQFASTSELGLRPTTSSPPGNDPLSSWEPPREPAATIPQVLGEDDLLSSWRAPDLLSGEEYETRPIPRYHSLFLLQGIPWIEWSRNHGFTAVIISDEDITSSSGSTAH